MTKDKLTQILLIEDDVKLAGLVEAYLTKHHFKVICAENGRTGLDLARALSPDIIILDLMMPEIDGLAVCRMLRSWYKGRILILTASDEDMDQVAALEIGADDFVTKPMHPRVLLARVRALLRRENYPIPDAQPLNHGTPEGIITYGGLVIHKGSRQIQLNGDRIELTDAEFDLLCLLAENPEQTLSRDEIMKATRRVEYDGLDRTVDNRIVALRRKLGDSQGLPKRIITVRGKGYLFTTDQWG